MSNFQIIVLSIFGFAIILGVLLFAGVLPGFRAPAGGSGGELVIWGSLSADDLTPFLSDFNKEYKSRFTLVYEEKSAETLEAELVDAIASGRSPDLVFLPQDLVVRQANKFSPFSGEEISLRDFKDSYVPAGEIYLTADGAIGLPVIVDPLVLYWNRNLFAAAGVPEPPKVWSEVVKGPNGLISKLTIFDPRNAITQSALAIGDFANVRHAKDILATLMMQAGSPIVVETETGYRTALVSSEINIQTPAKAALDFFIQFANPAKTTYTWNRSLPDSLEAFSGGLVAMYFGFASEWRRIRDKAPLINFDVAILPQRDRSRQTTFVNLFAVAVPRRSGKQLAAKEAARLIATGPFAWDLAQAVSLPPARRDLLSRSNKDPFLAAFYRAALIGRAWPDPDAAKTGQLFATMADAVLTGRTSSDQAITQAQSELELLLNPKSKR